MASPALFTQQKLLFFIDQLSAVRLPSYERYEQDKLEALKAFLQQTGENLTPLQAWTVGALLPAYKANLVAPLRAIAFEDRDAFMFPVQNSGTVGWFFISGLANVASPATSVPFTVMMFHQPIESTVGMPPQLTAATVWCMLVSVGDGNGGWITTQPQMFFPQEVTVSGRVINNDQVVAATTATSGTPSSFSLAFQKNGDGMYTYTLNVQVPAGQSSAAGSPAVALTDVKVNSTKGFVLQSPTGCIPENCLGAANTLYASIIDGTIAGGAVQIGTGTAIPFTGGRAWLDNQTLDTGGNVNFALRVAETLLNVKSQPVLPWLWGYVQNNKDYYVYTGLLKASKLPLRENQEIEVSVNQFLDGKPPKYNVVGLVRLRDVGAWDISTDTFPTVPYKPPAPTVLARGYDVDVGDGNFFSLRSPNQQPVLMYTGVVNEESPMPVTKFESTDPLPNAVGFLELNQVSPYTSQSNVLLASNVLGFDAKTAALWEPRSFASPCQTKQLWFKVGATVAIVVSIVLFVALFFYALSCTRKLKKSTQRLTEFL